MSEARKAELESALSDLAALAKREERPDRHHARALLVPLGELLHTDAAATGTVERARAAGEEPAWRDVPVNSTPVAMPAIAPSRFIRFQKMPRMIAGKNDAAASPKANATTSATNPGGLRPK